MSWSFRQTNPSIQAITDQPKSLWHQQNHPTASPKFNLIKFFAFLYKFSFVFPSLSLDKRRQHIYLASAKSGRDTAISESAKTRDNVCFICFMFNVAKPASRWGIRQKRHGGRERYFSPSSAANYGSLYSITQKLFFFFLLLCYVHFLSCYKFNLYNGWWFNAREFSLICICCN